MSDLNIRLALAALQRARDSLDDAAAAMLLTADLDTDRDSVLEWYVMVGQMMARIQRENQ